MRLRITDEALTDLERLVDFLRESHPNGARSLGREILDGLAILEVHPLVGRKVERGLRELVLSQGRSGYLALYRYRPPLQEVLVLRIRHQREAGFRE